MKKILLYATFATLAATTLGCSQPTEWNEQQRIDMREDLMDYREMVYLNNLSDAEFIIFTDDVAQDLETAFPVYTTFIVMPALSDTVDMWVVSSIVEELEADGANMRHLFPYDYLVSEGILPERLSLSQQSSFYSCFASRINNKYSGLEPFLETIIDNSLDRHSILKMEQECASDLFDWQITDIEIDEVVTE